MALLKPYHADATTYQKNGLQLNRVLFVYTVRHPFLLADNSGQRMVYAHLSVSTQGENHKGMNFQGTF